MAIASPLQKEAGTGRPTRRFKPVYPVVVATNRLGERDGVRQVLASYDNHPMAAVTPAVEFAQHSSLSTPDSSDENLQQLWLARLAVLDEATAAGWVPMPALAFGRWLDLLPFVRGNAGALPREMSDGMHPASLIDRAAFDAVFTEAHFKQFVRRVRYLRRVPIGAPRFRRLMDVPGGASPRPSNGVDLQEQLPPIPEGVVPLARELGVTAAADEDDPRIFFFRTDPGQAAGLLDLSTRPWVFRIHDLQPAARSTANLRLACTVNFTGDPSFGAVSGATAPILVATLAYIRTAGGDGLEVSISDASKRVVLTATAKPQPRVRRFDLRLRPRARIT